MVNCLPNRRSGRGYRSDGSLNTLGARWLMANVASGSGSLSVRIFNEGRYMLRLHLESAPVEAAEEVAP